jgi:Fuc2NAc and GlcNAc transferase
MTPLATIGVSSVVALLGSSIITGLVYRYALTHDVLDIPNDRSSHQTPTPRGGGMSIALVGLAAFVASWALGLLPLATMIGLTGGGAAVAVTGWLDDHSPLRAATRALVQVLASAWLLLWAVDLPVTPMGVGTGLFLVVVLVWCVNLFNFMDGIDGIAGGQGAVAAAAGALLLYQAGAPGLALGAAALAGACLGFLGWNWSPARIFMGDIGSNVLGFWFGGLAVLSDRAGGPPLWIWILLGGSFVVDATITLIRRMARGEQWYAAHRIHAYQRAVQSGFSHAQVSLAIIAFALVLAGLALAVQRSLLSPAGAIGLAGGLLGGAYLWIERRNPMPPRQNLP